MIGGEHSLLTGSQARAPTRADRVRQLNDEFRSTFDGGDVLITRGVRHLGFSAVGEIISLVRHFDDFKAENDPYGEHDFGRLRWNSQSIFWKIDYYDADLRFASIDPANPVVTRRVLTVMLSEEY